MGLTEATQDRVSAYGGKRRFPRYRLDARIHLSVFRAGTTIALWGRTNEIGPDGVGATLTEALHAGEVVSMELPIPVTPYIMKLRAIVRYTSGLRCGFEFLVVSDELRETLRRACELLAAAS
jgi:hypothetical protein